MGIVCVLYCLLYMYVVGLSCRYSTRWRPRPS